MTARLLIKNIANSFSTGDTIGVFDGSHVFGRLESKARFIENGNDASEWPRQFVIVNVVDAEALDYLYLMEDNEDGRRHYIQPQGPDSPFYDELIEHAEVTVNKSILDSLIIDRGA